MFLISKFNTKKGRRSAHNVIWLQSQFCIVACDISFSSLVIVEKPLIPLRGFGLGIGGGELPLLDHCLHSIVADCG